MNLSEQLTQQQTERIRAEVEQTILDFFADYQRADVDDTDRILAYFSEGIHGYGTGEHEIIEDLAAMRRILEADLSEMPEGIEIVVSIRSIRPLAENIASAIYLLDMRVPAGADTLDIQWRVSQVFTRADNTWRFELSHLSVPDADQAHGEALPVDAVRARTERLEREVAERTAALSEANRELQIEAALERVRARSMAMRSSEELADLSMELVQQVQGLGVDTWFCAFNIYDDEDPRGSIEWGSDGRGTIPHYRTPREGVFKRYFDAGHEGASLLVNEIGEDECPGHYEWLCSLPGVGDVLLDMKSAGIEFPTSQIDHVAYNRYGYLIFITFEPAPEAHDIFRRFSGVFEQTYTRFLDLKQAETQAREAQIQLALERIRVQSTSMQHSSELVGTSTIFHEQLMALGVPTEFSYVWLPDEAADQHQFWASWTTVEGDAPTHHSRAVTYDLDRNEPYTAACFEAWASDKKIFVDSVSPEDYRVFYETWRELLADAEHMRPERLAGGIHYAEAYMKYGCFGINIGREPTNDERDILGRFAVEFERAYTRFLDLKTAEAQARDAEIEASIERIRSRAMAMRESTDIVSVADTLRGEMQSLGLGQVYGCLLMLHIDGTRYRVAEMAGPVESDGSGLTFEIEFELQELGDGTHVHEILATDEYSVIYFDRDRLLAAADLAGLFDPVYAEAMRSFVQEGAVTEIWTAVNPLGAGKLCLDFFDEPDPEVATVMPRMAEAFDLAYRRFEDLQRAEAQAREARIETAMERVRSRAIGMQTSEELTSVADELRHQMGLLGQTELEVCGFHLYDGGGDTFETWGAMRTPGHSGDVLSGKAEFPRRGVAVLEEVIAGYESSESDYVIVNEGEKALEFFRMLEEHAPEQHAMIMKAIESTGGGQSGIAPRAYWSFSDFSGGSILMVTYEPPTDEARELLRRCADVFDLGYRRFKDLRAAERQAREEQVDAALERVRSRALAMTSSEELLDIIFKIHNEFAGLGFPCEQFWQTRYTPDVYQKALTAAGGQKLAAIMELPRDFSGVPELGEWEHGDDPIGVFKFDADAAWTYIHHMIEKGDFRELDPEGITEEDIRANGGLTFVQARTSHGEIGYALWGETDPSEEAKNVLIRFAGAFDLAYRRFEDLQQAEQDFVRLREEKERTERALKDLRATQKQLIEQEKLASLGSLTAGIAHEIKNPLNFVNNFAEVSEELMDELAAAVSAGDGDEAAALLDELRQNARQIAKHGGRADSIVRSMMQHAHGGSSERETIDVNAFVEEYVDLAWHGMRARDHTFQCDVERSLDPNAATIEGQPQELGRVLLNLLNNAFYALSMEGAAADPTVRVTTTRSNGRVTIAVTDSGPGIPDDIREKIFEPFFTTKPTGEGTGLGLSLSYDIVTKGHGGEMAVDNTSGGGASFTVTLPGQQS